MLACVNLVCVSMTMALGDCWLIHLSIHSSIDLIQSLHILIHIHIHIPTFIHRHAVQWQWQWQIAMGHSKYKEPSTLKKTHYHQDHNYIKYPTVYSVHRYDLQHQ